jgi:HK97 family phage prohead protease
MPWTDYPQAATENAKRALKLREEEGTDCGTPVGWESARILANREAVSHNRLPRYYSFLSRAKVYDKGSFKDEEGKQICGSIMYAAWGGDEMLAWAKKTYEEMENKNIRSGAFVTFTVEDAQGQGIITELREDSAVVADAEYDAELKAYVESKPQILRELHVTELKVIEVEVRSKNDIVEQRAYEGELKAVADSRTVEGYASVFNSMSEDLGGFREIILPGAFSEVLDNDVRALYNHDINYLLARTASGTLELWEDDKGLGYRFEMPNTSYGNDMLELFKRGDLSQSSFGFTVEKDSWKMENGQHVRYIERVGSLFDVSPVVYPAYSQASSGLRSAEPKGESAAGEVRETPAEELNYNIYNALIKLAKDEC